MSGFYFLYAEDDADDVDFLHDALSSVNQDIELKSVKNGFELIRFLENVKESEPFPSLIILDVKMPRLDGISTLRLLRSDDLYRLIPVVLFTSAFDYNNRDLRKLGVDVELKGDAHAMWRTTCEKWMEYCV